MWNKISKPNTSNWTKVSKQISNYPQYGYAIYGLSRYGITDRFIKVAKPVTSNWTKVPKPI